MRDHRDERWDPDTAIEYFGGAAPVQTWGTIAGKRFYFRARHNGWSLGIALSPAVDPVDVLHVQQLTLSNWSQPTAAIPNW